MWICKNCGQSIDDDLFKCWKCGANEDGEIDPSFEKVAEDPIGGELVTSDQLILSNTSLAGLYPCLKILGLVCSELIISTDFITEVFDEVVNFVSGESKSYQTYIEDARRKVTQDIINQALKVKANAIMGIQYGYENIGNGMVLVSITGTAVITGL